MLMFTLAISCLTTSNLLWFMDWTSQVPMQYCSLQHQTLLPSPLTSTTGCCFCLGSISSRSRWWSRRMCAHLLLWELQNYNLLLNNYQQENVGSHQKKTPHIQGQSRSPSKMVGGETPHLESNPIPTRDTQRAQTRDPTATEPDLILSIWLSLVEVRVSSGWFQGQGLWVQQSWVWHQPSWRRSPLTLP